MQSIRELYRIGHGPSSSHTMGPRKAAELFRQRTPDAARYRVTLYGSLAATGKGHLTDVAIAAALAPVAVDFVWRPEEELPMHPNGMSFEAIDVHQSTVASLRIYSPGGGEIRVEGEPVMSPEVYMMNSMQEIMRYCTQSGKTFWEYVQESEDSEIWNYLAQVNQVMHAAIERGLHAEGVLPGGLGLARRAWTFYRKIHLGGGPFRNEGFLPAYALAVAEENATGSEIVTAPTCGSCGVVPAVMRHIEETIETSP